MATAMNAIVGTVEPFPQPLHDTSVTDELDRILGMLREAAPKNATISFDFDGRLSVHIDVRTVEDITRVEAVLPVLGRGMFHGLSRKATPHHPFYHRVSALVDC